MDFGSPDDGGERKSGLEHGEVIADARAGARAERDVLPAVTSQQDAMSDNSATMAQPECLAIGGAAEAPVYAAIAEPQRCGIRF
jgi:hypothetical protein